MAVDTRPTTLTVVHNYNLRNQGWPNVHDCSPNAGGDGNVVTTDPVQYTKTKIGVYPSNADIIWAAKLDSAATFTPLNSYSPWRLEKNIFGNTPAAKGHFILNAFNRNRQSVSTISGVYDPARDKEEWRPISVAFHAGRIWYLMQTGVLYYSQTLTELANASKCYQDADPTAEDINEIIATDGGLIDISGIAKGLKLIPVRTEIAVIANNGVWTVSGTSDGGFTATDQEIQQITNVGAIGKDTVVEAENVIYYWSKGGIYALVQDQVSGALTPQNISETTIQNFYLSIPEISRANAKVTYDEAQKKVYWLYNDTEDYDGINYRFQYNKALIFDLTLQAFYTYSFEITDDSPVVTGMFRKQNFSSTTQLESVTADGELVESNGEQVVVRTPGDLSSSVGGLKLTVFDQQSNTNWKYTFGEFNSNTLVDWFSKDSTGINYESYLETGHDIVEDLAAESEAGLVSTFFKRTEQNFIENQDGSLDFDTPSSCLMRAKWQWSDSENSGRWSEEQQVYRLNRFLPGSGGTFDYGFEVIQTKNQIRGKGNALSLRFSSEQGKDFHLLGWSIPYTVLTGL